MGYTLIIGQAVIDYDQDEGTAQVDAEEVRLEHAPAFGEPTDNTNERWPSYSSWADSMRALGLVDVMFNKRNGGRGIFESEGKPYLPLMQSHPGETAICKAHVDYVRSAIEKYKAAHSTHRAEYPPPKPGAVPRWGTSGIYLEEDYDESPEYDSALCRGEWLLFWLEWAIENCSMPVFVNR